MHRRHAAGQQRGRTQDDLAAVSGFHPAGFAFESEWFAPHFEFRFPLIGEVTYNNTYPAQFATLAQLGPGGATCTTPAAANACLIDNLLASSKKSGYTFYVTAGAAGTGTYTDETAEGDGMALAGKQAYLVDGGRGIFNGIYIDNLVAAIRTSAAHGGRLFRENVRRFVAGDPLLQQVSP